MLDPLVWKHAASTIFLLYICALRRSLAVQPAHPAHAAGGCMCVTRRAACACAVRPRSRSRTDAIAIPRPAPQTRQSQEPRGNGRSARQRRRTTVRRVPIPLASLTMRPQKARHLLLLLPRSHVATRLPAHGWPPPRLSNPRLLARSSYRSYSPLRAASACQCAAAASARPAAAPPAPRARHAPP